jgi:Ca-activated chloride channel family protein
MRLGCAVCVAVALAACTDGGSGAGPTTIAEVEVIRPAVSVGGTPVAGDARVGPGGVVAVGESGRAWLRHDGALKLLLDGGAKARVEEDAVVLLEGRLFADAEAALAIRTDGVRVEGAGAAFEARREGEGLALYVARGRVAWQAGATARGEVRAGELAVLDGKSAKVTPALLWDDWTGGLGWPEASGASGGSDGRRAFGEVGARRPGSLGEARFPLAITRLEVRARIDEDQATTRVVQTFFNPASDTLEGLYRVRIPEGAILRRFAIDRNGRWADGYVKERETARQQYQAQVYQGSTKDPALLEWEAPGSYRARLYPLPAGASRKILVEYTEWLTARGPEATRSWRYPMAAGANAPLLQELDIEVDVEKAGAKSVRAGLGARIVDGKKVALERTDYRPRADLVVDLVGPARPASQARAYRAPHKMLGRVLAGEDDYYLVRTVPLPREAANDKGRSPLDLVILADVSAGTDPVHLQLARTTAEALLRHLGPDDRVALVGADLELHAPGKAGKPALVPAQRATTEQLLEALARQGTGGATDLGAVLTQAAGLLEPKRRGAVVYIGDALPTVGELDVKGLRERLDRLPAPLRLYGVALGDEGNLGLLEALSAEGGFALRVGDRGGAAGAALRILEHASRRAIARLTVDLGPSVDRVYPRRPITAVAGEPITVVARVKSGVPVQAALRGLLDGEAWSATHSIVTRPLAGDDDLRLRWASARLGQLLADGASAEEVAELGTRQNLITPFTSFYVPSADELTRLVIEPEIEVRAAGCSMRKAEAPPPPPSSEAVAVNLPKAEGAYDEPRRAPASGSAAASKPMASAPVDVTTAEAAPATTTPAMPEPPKAEPEPAPEAERAKERAIGKDANLEREQGGEATAALDDLKATDGDVLGAGPGGGGTGSGTIGLGSIGTIGRGSGSGGLADYGKKAASPRPRATMDEGKMGRRDARVSSGRYAIAVDKSEDRRALDNGNDGGDDVDDTGRDLILQINVYGHRARRCSAAAKLPASERRDLWRERLSTRHTVEGALEVWQDALQGCELRSWGDRTALLRAMLDALHSGPSGAPRLVQLYQRFSEDDAAQGYLRRAILGHVRTAADLKIVVDGLGLGEDAQRALAMTLVAKAKTPADRVAVLEQLAQRWPDNLQLKLSRIEAYEQAGRPDEARRLAEEVRADPYADARARTVVGELLARAGDLPSARRAFSEIVEFAPRDPLARRRLGDLYRAHGWWDEAYRQYQTLAELSPGDSTVLLLLAAAAAGAGRIDEGLRLADRVAEGTEAGNETGVARVARWWTTVRLALLRQAARDKGDANEVARLFGRTRRAGVLADARPFRAYLLWAHPEADCELAATLPGNLLVPATDLAPELGLVGLSSREALQSAAVVEVRRPPSGAASSLRYTAQLVVMLDEGQKSETVLTVPLEFGPGVDAVKVRIADRKAEVIQ